MIMAKHIRLVFLVLVLVCGRAAATTLEQAIYQWNIEQVQKLIDNGADVNKENDHGKTPLQLAASYEKQDIAQLLIEHGAVLDMVSAVHLGWADEVEKFLLQGEDANQKEKEHDRNSLLNIAVDNDDRDVVLLLLKHDADINATDNYGNTPLHAAAGSDSPDVLKILLEHGADVNKKNERDETCLHDAVARDKTAHVDLLLQAGADVGTTNEEGETPLHEAAYWGHEEVAEILLEHGADIHATDEDGETPLFKATYHGYTDIIQLLLDAGADINARDEDGHTPLQSAISGRKYNTAIMLYEKGAALELDDAVTLGLFDEAEQMLEKGVDANQYNFFTESALYTAVEFGYTDIVKLLLDHGARVESIFSDMDYFEATLLNRAIEKGFDDIVIMLLDADADISAVGGAERMAALHSAASNGRTEIVRTLIQRGADINQKSEREGLTPLCYAASGGHADVIRLLVEKGADINDGPKESIYRFTPLVISMINHHVYAANTLIELGAKVDFASAVQLFRFDDMKKSLEQGQNIHALVNEYESALHFAAHYGLNDVVQYLLDHDADVNFQFREYDEIYGYTPLQTAAVHGRRDTAQLLIDNGAEMDLFSAAALNMLDTAEQLIAQGADVNKEYHKDYTALHAAVLTDNHEMIRLLLKHGADIDDMADYDTTPLHITVDKHLPGAARVLLENGADMTVCGESRSGAGSMALIYGDEEIVNVFNEYSEDYDGMLDLDSAVLLNKPDQVAELLQNNKMPSYYLYDYLEFAASHGHTEIVRSLLDHGVPLEDPESYRHKQSPLDKAALLGFEDIVNLLIDRGAKHSLISASALGLDAELEQLLPYHIDREELRNEDFYHLHIAAFYDHEKAVEILLGHGYGANEISDFSGRSALHISALRGSTASARVLLEHGADVRALDNLFGETPLHMAAKTGHTETVSLLLEHNSDVNAPNLFGCTPLDVAKTCNADTIQVLEQHSGAPGDHCYEHLIECENDFSLTD